MSYQVKANLQTEEKEMRAIYCDTLCALAREDSRICALDADLIGSSGMQPFFTEFPDRAIDCGIQEANMVGVAAGLSSAGMVPFAHSFGPFATRRVMDQIFISCAYGRQNVRIVGSDPGVTAAYNGGTHMPFEDMGCLLSIPKITLIEPSDSVQLEQVLHMLKDAYGVYYIRLLRKNAVGIYEKGSTFTLGKAPVLRQGKDVCIAASGIMVAEALKAANVLAEQGISASVVDCFTWKPLDDETLTQQAKTCGCLVTAENHNVMGGLGSAVASSLAKTCPVPLEMVGVQDEFGEVGTVDYLQERFGLTAAAIVAAAQRAIGRK